MFSSQPPRPGPATLAIHGQQQRDAFGGPPMPIYATTTFAFPDTAALLEVTEGRRHGPLFLSHGRRGIACHLLGLTLLALALLIANLLAYTTLWGLTIIRLVRYPRRLADDMIDHARGPGFFTIVAGTCILGTQWHIVLGSTALIPDGPSATIAPC